MIDIEIKRAKEVPGRYACFLTFSRFNQNWVEVIRQLSSRSYDKENRVWEFPLYYLSDIVSRYPNVPINIRYHKEPDNNVVDIPEIELKRPLFAHQKLAVDYGIMRKKYLLLDTMGLGKTTSVIAEALTLKKMGLIKQCLIVCCVSDLQYNWAKEIETVCDESYFILGTRYRTKKLDANGKPKAYAGSVKDRVEDLWHHDEFFLITNKETLRNDEFISILRGEYKKKKSNVTFLAIDEVHRGTGDPTTAAGKNLQKLSDMEYIIPMTGTLIRNRPFDAWAPLHLIGEENSTYGAFKGFYGVYGEFSDVIRYRNLDHLEEQLAGCSLRRTKEDVLDLPEKIYSDVVVTMNDRQRLIYEEAETWAIENIDKISESPNPLSQLIRLRQATGYTGILSSVIQESAKLDRIEQDVEDIVEHGEKCLIFSNWTDITDELYNRISKKHKVLRITGKDIKSGEETEDIKHKFQNDPQYQILIGTTGKMGTGHTLTAAQWVLFADEPWTSADKDQAVDRTHRPGQVNSVNIRTYLTMDTIDMKVNYLVKEKGDLADRLVDGKVGDRKHLVKYMLGLENSPQ